MMTALDTAHAAMMLDLDDDAARLRFFGVIADSELIVLVLGEAEGSALKPRVFPLEDGPVIMAFDTEDRLTAFTNAPSPYAALPGRLIVAQLAGQGVAIGLNLDVAPSSILLPAAVVDWLALTLASNPDQVTAAPPVRFHAHTGLSSRQIGVLENALLRAAGLADCALLALAEDEQGLRRPILAFVNAEPARQDALTRMVSEAVAFDGQPEHMPDIVFLRASDPILDRLTPVAFRIGMPLPEPIAPAEPVAPGTDPDRPPILR